MDVATHKSLMANSFPGLPQLHESSCHHGQVTLMNQFQPFTKHPGLWARCSGDWANMKYIEVHVTQTVATTKLQTTETQS